MKRLITLAVSLVLIAAVTAGLGVAGADKAKNEIPPHSETFAGSVSAATFDSEESAARAFLTEQIAGATSNPQYTKYEKLADMTEAELAALSEAHLVDGYTLLGGERVQIGYTENGKDSSVLTYFIRTTTGILYYIAPQENGQPLTADYFDSVWRGSNYVNCTATTTVSLCRTGGETPGTTNYIQRIYFADDKAYFAQEVPGTVSELYFTEVEGGLMPYMHFPERKDDQTFYSLAEINRISEEQYHKHWILVLCKGNEQVDVSTLETIADIADFAFMLELDASYFVKTDFGFSMPEEKYENVYVQLFGEEARQTFEAYHIHLRADFYVYEGRLSKETTVLTMSNGEEVIAVTIETVYSDFGTTTVELPADRRG